MFVCDTASWSSMGFKMIFIYMRNNFDENRVAINNGNMRENSTIKSTIPPAKHREPTILLGSTTDAKQAKNCSKQPSPATVDVKPTTNASLLHQLKYTTEGMEAFAVLVQYLTKDPDVYSLSAIKKELQEYKNECEKNKEKLAEEAENYKILEVEFLNNKRAYEEKLEDVHNVHLEQLSALNNKHETNLRKCEADCESKLMKMEKAFQHEGFQIRSKFQEQLNIIERKADEKLKRILDEAVYEMERLKIENTACQQSIVEESRKKLNQLECHFTKKEKTVVNEFEALKEQYETRLCHMNDELQKKEKEVEFCILENEIERNRKRRTNLPVEEAIVEHNESKTKAFWIPPRQDFQNLEDEVCSLRTVLDLKHSEMQELRKQNEKLRREVDDLPLISQRLDSSLAKIEDLTEQLLAKTNAEKKLLKENQRLTEAIQLETEKKKRLEFQNEELIWKLKRSTQVAKALAAIGTNRNNLQNNNIYLEENKRNGDFKYGNSKSSEFSHIGYSGKDKGIRRSHTDNDLKFIDSPTETSQKVLGVVEKNDSVSWVLEIDEPPIEVASRMLRRANSLRGVPSKKKTVNSHLYTLPSRSKKHNRPILHSSTMVDFSREKSDFLNGISFPNQDERQFTPSNIKYRSFSQSDAEFNDKRTNEGVLSNMANEDTPDISAIFDFLQDSDMEDNTDRSDLQDSYCRSDNIISFSESTSESSLEMDDYAKSDKKFLQGPSLPAEHQSTPSTPIVPKISAGEAMISKAPSETEITSDCSIEDTNEKFASNKDISVG